MPHSSPGGRVGPPEANRQHHRHAVRRLALRWGKGGDLFGRRGIEIARQRQLAARRPRQRHPGRAGPAQRGDLSIELLQAVGNDGDDQAHLVELLLVFEHLLDLGRATRLFQRPPVAIAGGAAGVAHAQRFFAVGLVALHPQRLGVDVDGEVDGHGLVEQAAQRFDGPFLVGMEARDDQQRQIRQLAVLRLQMVEAFVIRVGVGDQLRQLGGDAGRRFQPAREVLRHAARRLVGVGDGVVPQTAQRQLGVLVGKIMQILVQPRQHPVAIANRAQGRNPCRRATPRSRWRSA